MKASFFKSALLAIGAMAMLASCDFLKKEDVLVGFSSATPFADGTATLTVSLSSPASSNVSVSISCDGNLPNGGLTFSSPVEIPAGSTSGDCHLTLNEDKFSPGEYDAVFTIVSVKGAKVDPSKNTCSLKLIVEEDPVNPVVTPSVVSISNYSESFTDGKASFTLALDKAADSDVYVNFSVQTEVEGYAAIPASALTFDNPAIIPAGALSKEISVTLDESAVQKGVSNYAIIVISSVSDNAVVASSKTKTYIEATAPLAANLRSDWTVAFAGEYERDGVVYHTIEVKGVGENDGYYIFPYNAGTVDFYFNGDMTAFIKTMEEIVAEPLGTEQAYQIKKGSTGWLYQKFPVGEYEIWMLGCSESGHLTGDYATSTFKIEATPEVLAAYNKWLGEWNVTRQSKTDKWVITEDVPGASFCIQGIDGDNPTIADIQVYADYDAANDEIVLYTQDCKTWSYNGTDYTIALIGMYENSTKLVTGDFDLAVISRTGDNSATIKSGGTVTVSGGSTFDVTGMTFFAIPPSGSGYVFNGQVFYLWPETMTRIEAIENDPVYNAFLGDWNIKRMNSEWDDSANAFKETGEVSDTWTISPKLAGYTFYISGFEGFSDVVIVADYNAASGSLSVSEQSFTIGEYKLATLALFHYPGDAQYPAGDYLWNGGATAFTGKVEGDSIKLTPGKAGDYGDFVMFQLFQLENDYYYNYHGDGYVLPNTLTKAAAPNAVSKKAMGKAQNAGYRLSKSGSQMQRMSAPATGVYRGGDKMERNLPLK
ncbi:MAG: hypothetical protein IKZ51_07015 [Bacteroidales bacterium]|nr:hypothetical protein [Bacteroidales bacterium]